VNISIKLILDFDKTRPVQQVTSCWYRTVFITQGSNTNREKDNFDYQ
jgi:hypothetical protein